MSRKRMLVDVDENQWAALKGQAEVEGRFVRVLLAEAIGALLAQRRGDHALVPSSPLSPLNVPPAQVPMIETLRALGERVEKVRRPWTRDEIAERQAWLRDHPEDEQQ